MPSLPLYGLIMVIATYAGLECAAQISKRAGYPARAAWEAALWVLPLGLIGARAWFVLFPPLSVVALGRDTGWMLSHFLDLNQGAVAVWSGGLGLAGFLIGGLIGLALYAQRSGLALPALTDIAVIGLALAQTLGRWANGANGEHYGPPTGISIGQAISDPALRYGPYRDLMAYPLETTLFHPVWLYESLLCLGIFFVLLVLYNTQRGRRPAGWFTALYAVLYSAGRLPLELLRGNVALVGGFPVMVGVLALALMWGVWRLRR